MSLSMPMPILLYPYLIPIAVPSHSYPTSYLSQSRPHLIPLHPQLIRILIPMPILIHPNPILIHPNPNIFSILIPIHPYLY